MGSIPRSLAAVAAQETGGPGSNAGPTSSATAATATASSRSTTAGTLSPRRRRRWIPASNADYAAGMLSGLLAQIRRQRPRGALRLQWRQPRRRPARRPPGATAQDLGYADSVMRTRAADADRGPRPESPRRPSAANAARHPDGVEASARQPPFGIVGALGVPGLGTRASRDADPTAPSRTFR